MNQEKTGRFIAELRKEKGMTQTELADKLGITDRAISKWENGRGLPDISLLVPLCEILGVSINELLSGEKINKNDYQEKFEENIISTIDYTDKKIKKTKKCFIAVLSLILILFSSLSIMFVIDVNRMRNSEPVIFSTWGYSYTPPIDLKEDEIELAVMNFLTEAGDSEPKHHTDEKTFVSMRIYLLEEIERDGLYNIYAWVVKEKYYTENDEIKKDSGASAPYKFVVKNAEDNFSVTDYMTPRDGTLHTTDMRRIFPLSVRNDMKKAHMDGTVEGLHSDIEQQIRLYFHK